MTYRATNPTTGEFIYELPSMNQLQRNALLTRVANEQFAWRRAPLESRLRFVAALGAALRSNRDALAEALTLEMGKPIAAARAEVEKCAVLCDAAPSLARAALTSDLIVDDPTAHVHVQYDPLGCVLAIMPWNFPYWQALRFVVPALCAGNGVIIKPAHSVPGPARLLGECLADARAALAHTDTPAAPCHVALLPLEMIDDLIADARIVGVTLTGSDRAGRHVAEVAGRHLKKVVLELGGSDPYLVLPDADVAKAAAMAVTARTVNNGQSCIAAKRFIVCDAVYDEFLARFSDGMRALVVGDPFEEGTQVGPIATASVRDDLRTQMQTSIAAGARAVVGGPDQPAHTVGYFIAPTILVDIAAESPAATDELFGPVASVFRVADTAAAITLANRSRFGLGASVWTQSDDEADRCIAELEAGMIFVNDMVVSDARYPFGGVKESGVGRELGLLGFREFTNAKTVRRKR